MFLRARQLLYRFFQDRHGETGGAFLLRELGIPKGYRPLYALTLGYSDETLGERLLGERIPLLLSGSDTSSPLNGWERGADLLELDAQLLRMSCCRSP